MLTTLLAATERQAGFAEEIGYGMVVGAVLWGFFAEWRYAREHRHCVQMIDKLTELCRKAMKVEGDVLPETKAETHT